MAQLVQDTFIALLGSDLCPPFHLFIHDDFNHFQTQIIANFGTVKNGYYNATYVVFAVTLATMSNAALGPNKGKFKVGTDSADLTFNIVTTPLDFTTNALVRRLCFWNNLNVLQIDLR